MWGDWLEKGKQLASQAQAAALEIDRKINESVGIDDHAGGGDVMNDTTANNITDSSAWDADDDAFAGLDDDAFAGLEDNDNNQAPPSAVTEPVDANDGWGGDDVDIVDDDVLLLDDEPEVPSSQTQSNNNNNNTKEEESPDNNEAVAPVQEPPKEEPEVQEPTEEPPVPVESEPSPIETVPATTVTTKEGDGETIVNKDDDDDDDGVGNNENEVEDDTAAPAVPPSPPLVATAPTQVTASPAAPDWSNLPPTPASSTSDRELALEKQLAQLGSMLHQREEQLLQKTDQMTQMASLFENEKSELQQRVANTKEEAKKRIQKAKERCEAMEGRLNQALRQSNAGEQDSAKQAEIIAELREEGEKLALKQAEMEKAVRTAKGDARGLREELEEESSAKMQALEQIEKLKVELAEVKESLASARRGESQAGKLDSELRQIKEDNDRKANTILSLEQTVKELNATVKSQKSELVETQKGAVVETEKEVKKLRKEHTDAVADLEAKLQTTEREAGVREDALRHEIAELRKRWQDAVRRADSLSMDIQTSTAPLLRQLESAERQNRLKASAWAELEGSLRSQLEETVIANEQLSKDRSEWKTRATRSERALQESDRSLQTTRADLEDRTSQIQLLEERIEDLERKGAKMKEEYTGVQRLANEGVTKVRNEMAQTVQDAEDRHQAQVDILKRELDEEREKKGLLEKQVAELLEKDVMIVPPQAMHKPVETKPVKLRRSENQVDILAGALGGLDGDDEDDDSDDDDDDSQDPVDHGGSMAALSDLRARLKATTMQMAVQKKQLEESENRQKAVMDELQQARKARDKLPLFEQRVQELTQENLEMSREIESLQLEMEDIRQLFRAQLDELIEEKAQRDAAVLLPPDDAAATESTTPE